MQRFELGLSMINELTPRGRFVSLAASKGHSCSRARLPTVERYPTAPIRPRFARRPPGQAGGNEGPHPYRPAQKSIIPSVARRCLAQASAGEVEVRPGRRGGPFSTKWGRACPPGADPGVCGRSPTNGVWKAGTPRRRLSLLSSCKTANFEAAAHTPSGPPGHLPLFRGEGEMSGPFSQLGPIDLIVVAALPPFPLGGRCRAPKARWMRVFRA